MKHLKLLKHFAFLMIAPLGFATASGSEIQTKTFAGKKWVVSLDGKEIKTRNLLLERTYDPKLGALSTHEWTYSADTLSPKEIYETTSTYKIEARGTPSSSDGFVNTRRLKGGKTLKLYDTTFGDSLYSEIRIQDREGRQSTLVLEHSDALTRSQFEAKRRALEKSQGVSLESLLK